MIVFRLFVLLLCAALVTAYEKEVTIQVDAGKNECFFHFVKAGESIDIEYQVIDGGHGELDISFSLVNPQGLVLVADFKKPENLHRHLVDMDGDYRFCFDNTISSFNRKVVFFELVIDKVGEQNLGDKQWNDVLQGLTPDEVYEMTVQDIMDYIGKIRMQMTKAKQIQDILRSQESRDRRLAENNFTRVNTWSCFQITAMLLVGFLQVFMLKNIFEINSWTTKYLKKINM